MNCERLQRATCISAAGAALVALACGCSPVTTAEGASGRALLFVGNSLTYTNDLPAMLARVAAAAQDSVRVAMVAGPNLALVDHTNGATDAAARIDGDDWAFVVLQQGPTPPGVCRDTLVIAAMRLAPHIRAAGARAVLLAPWPRRDSPEFVEAAAESAELAARAVGGAVAPVGAAWRSALAADPGLPLYGTDGYHPAPAGTLLAALTVYDRLFGRDVRRISAAALIAIPAVSLTPAQVETLAAAAHAASDSVAVDSPVPVPPDTTRPSPGGGPC